MKGPIPMKMQAPRKTTVKERSLGWGNKGGVMFGLKGSPLGLWLPPSHVLQADEGALGLKLGLQARIRVRGLC